MHACEQLVCGGFVVSVGESIALGGTPWWSSTERVRSFWPQLDASWLLISGLRTLPVFDRGRSGQMATRFG